MKIKKDDEVIVLTGKYRGKKGTVVKAFPKDEKILVSGVNVVKRHQKPGMGGAGGIVEKELPLHVSNVAYYDKEADKAVKVGYTFLEDGSKVRISKATGEQLD